jgi:hypothetical protein
MYICPSGSFPLHFVLYYRCEIRIKGPRFSDFIYTVNVRLKDVINIKLKKQKIEERHNIFRILKMTTATTNQLIATTTEKTTIKKTSTPTLVKIKYELLMKK